MKALKLLILSLTILQVFTAKDQNITVSDLEDDTIKLTENPTDGGRPLFEVMINRKSGRDYNATVDMTLKQLSELLWSGYGPNREDKHKTVPSAVAMYPFTFYVFLKGGVYKYNPDKNTLKVVVHGDYRDAAGSQAFVKNADVNIAIVVDYETKGNLEKKQRTIYALLDAGHCSQNMYLYCAHEEMNCVVRGMFDNDKILEVLDLDDDRYEVITTFSAGY